MDPVVGLLGRTARVAIALRAVFALRPPRPPWRADRWLLVPAVVCLVAAVSGQAFSFGGAGLGGINSATARLITFTLGVGLLLLSFFVVVGGKARAAPEAVEVAGLKTQGKRPRLNDADRAKLKDSCQALAQRIYGFLNERGSGDKSYDQQTLARYSAAFGAAIVSLANKLKKNGVPNAELQRLYGRQKSIDEIDAAAYFLKVTAPELLDEQD